MNQVADFKSSPEIGEIATITIEKLTTGGRGLGRLRGWVVFVPFVAAGETCSIRITEVRSNFALAELITVDSASDQRRIAPCNYYQECGGCSIQHLHYGEQLRAKEGILSDLLRGFKSDDLEIFPIIPSPLEFGYRSRIQVHSNGSIVGFHKHRSHEIVEVASCLLAQKEVNAQLAALRTKKLSPAKGTKSAHESPSRIVIGASRDQDFFSQVNPEANHRLVELVVQAFQRSNFNEFVDLFCGAGNFSFPLLNSKPKAIGWACDNDHRAIEHARKKCQELNISGKKLQFFASNADSWLMRFPLPSSAFVVVDPPRSGLSTVMTDLLARQNLGSLIYVSCNPSTFFRDAKALVHGSKGRLQLRKIQALDLFPQTHHFELVAEFHPC